MFRRLGRRHCEARSGQSLLGMRVWAGRNASRTDGLLTKVVFHSNGSMETGGNSQETK